LIRCISSSSMAMAWVLPLLLLWIAVIFMRIPLQGERWK
jgi:hypothetical protein